MNTKGFTLIEVLVGLFIAVVASLYASKIITSTNRVSSTGRDTFIATNLAREGIDLSRAMRENAWFENAVPGLHTDWLSKKGICPGTLTYSFTIDQGMVRRSEFVRNTNNPVLYVQGDKSWSHTVSGNATPFSRVVTADCTHVFGLGVPGNPAYVTITSAVSWTGQGGSSKSVELKEILSNWF